MIQFNLLPRVKLDYVKTKRHKRTVALVATLVSAGALTVLVLLFIAVQMVQRKYSSDLSNDIQTESSKLNSIQDLNKVLTIQNQLNSLTPLHDQKPVASRLFGYIQQLTPNKVSIAKLTVDFATNTMGIEGKVEGKKNTLQIVNQYVDTLKFTTYGTQPEETLPAFSEVVLSDFGKTDKEATYKINLKFDPVVFAGTKQVTLTVPDRITTRSETEKPAALFQPVPTNEDEEQR